MGNVEERLKAMGEILPEPKSPVANYLGCKRSGDILYVSGRVSDLRGEVGTEVSLEEAKTAAKDTMLLLLAIVKAEIGDLDLIVSVEQVTGFVRGAASFIKRAP